MQMTCRNVNDAFSLFIDDIYNGRIDTTTTPSRYGEVITIEEPVMVKYVKPTEKVLFNKERDCNPFFHVYEALWMLAGCNDVNSLTVYNKRMQEFSDDGITLNGAYGYRWRHAKHGVGSKGNSWYGGTIQDHRDEVDQLKLIIEHLRNDPGSRRVVLQMWNVEDDLLNVGTKCKQCNGTGRYKGKYTPDDPTSPLVDEVCEDCEGTRVYSYSKDVCCNLSVLFRIRNADNNPGRKFNVKILDMTVLNRSNDLVWGMLGSNYVHFTFLQEYMAYATGCIVGNYYHITNNLHCYTNTWKPKEWIKANVDNEKVEYGTINKVGLMHNNTGASVPEWTQAFDNECKQFVEHYGKEGLVDPVGYDSEFLDTVAEPMMLAFKLFKDKQYIPALKHCEMIAATDWKIACTNWIERRIAKTQAK